MYQRSTPENSLLVPNSRPPGGKLDGERIITGSGGSVYYTPDHFISWLQVR